MERNKTRKNQNEKENMSKFAEESIRQKIRINKAGKNRNFKDNKIREIWNWGKGISVWKFVDSSGKWKISRVQDESKIKCYNVKLKIRGMSKYVENILKFKSLKIPWQNWQSVEIVLFLEKVVKNASIEVLPRINKIILIICIQAEIWPDYQSNEKS